MKISDRFTDYGLIGGFFWTLQLALIFLVFKESQWAAWLRVVSSVFGSVPKDALPLLSTMLGALALITIFSTGLLLDLFGSFYFRGFEMRLFVRHIKRNEVWLRRLLRSNQDYVQDDLSPLLGISPMFSKKRLLLALKMYAFWNKRYRQEIAESLRTDWKPFGPYVRLQSFLLSYVLLAPGTEKIELLSTQISVWSISRAISTAIALIALEMTVLLSGILGGGPSYRLGLMNAIQIGLSIGAMFVVLAAYERICSTLFALVYLTSSKSVQSISAASESSASS